MKNKSHKNNSISACMMVKNEAKLLPQCLESIKDHVDEIIIVDTGSTDDTVAIAESFGAKVYHHPWEDNFSKHRNQSLEYATCQWCLIIDADEKLVKQNGVSLRNESAHMREDIDSLLVVVENASSNNGQIIPVNSIRVVRNRPEIRYRGRVHNYLVGLKKTRPIPIRLFHYGYNLGKEMNEKKFVRTTNLLKLDIEEDPENPRPYHFMAVSHLTCKLHKSAAEYAEKAIALYENVRLVPHNYLWCLYIAANSHLALENIGKAEQFAKKGTSFFPDHLDSHYILIGCYMLKSDSRFWYHKERFFEIHKRIENKPEDFGEIVQNTFRLGWKVLIWAGIMAMEEGNLDKKNEDLALAKHLAPDDFDFHLELGQSLKYKKYLHESESEFQKALDLRPENTKPYIGLLQLYIETGDRKAQTCLLDRFISSQCNDIHDSLLMASTAKTLSLTDRAKTILQKIISMEPYNPDARLLLGQICLNCNEYLQALSLAEEVLRFYDSRDLRALSLMGKVHYHSGNYTSAIDSFQKMAGTDSALLEPHVYIADLFLRSKDIEGCVHECDELLRILNLDRDITLNCFSDIGSQFFRVAESLVQRSEMDLMKRCLQIGRTLISRQTIT
jgi:glycosyltransferase involved in cell wall biosynthesis